MSINETKPFTESALDTFFGKLKACRITTELKALHTNSKNSILVKSLIAIAALVAAVAVVVFLHSSTTFLGFGIGVLILSLYAIYHYRHQHKHASHLFKTATAAMTQI